ncbi:MAG: recombinase family protein [Acidobacteria bacterium]|nr:recombinase family protein [Acidobacteriota bacterium]
MAADAKAAPRLRCAIYTRKSTSAGLEKDFNSLDAQREACEAFIRSRALEGWEALAEEFSDGGFTGANTDRPGFQKLLDHVRRRAVDVVVVYKVDRLSRSLVDFAQVMAHFNQHGVAFVSVTQNFSTTDPVGRLTLNMLMSFAEFEREMITERIRDKVLAQRRKGKWTGGHAPLGYLGKDHRLQVAEEEASWVRQVFAWYLEGLSAVSIAERLNDAGVPLKSSSKPRPRPWTKDLVLRILRNRLYVGELHCRGEFVVAEHPALVESEVFEAVQRKLEPKRRRGEVISLNPSYLVRGTLVCGACGGRMTSASTHRGERIHRYYRCSTRDKRGKKACPTTQLPAEALERFVVEHLRAVLTAPEQREQANRWIRRAFPELPKTLSGFDELWKALDLRHRQSLVRLVVEEVRVEERRGALAIRLRDLQALMDGPEGRP